VVQVFVHFSLAPFTPIGDNPALSRSSGTWASKSKRVARGATGAKQNVPAREQTRSQKDKASGPAFHSFFTSVEIPKGFPFLNQ
jgi:hypothetical protein